MNLRKKFVIKEGLFWNFSFNELILYSNHQKYDYRISLGRD